MPGENLTRASMLIAKYMLLFTAHFVLLCVLVVDAFFPLFVAITQSEARLIVALCEGTR